MEKDERKPYGYIYRATNLVNDKYYMGQTVAGRWKERQNPIKERWKEEVGEAYRKEARGENRDSGREERVPLLKCAELKPRNSYSERWWTTSI